MFLRGAFKIKINPKLGKIFPTGGGLKMWGVIPKFYLGIYLEGVGGSDQEVKFP